MWNHGAKVVFGISGDSGHLNKIKNLDVGREARWNPTGKSSGGPPSIFQGAINFPPSQLHASGEGDQARRDPGRSEELQAECRRLVCVSEAFPQGALPPASAPLGLEEVWNRCGVLGVLWKKVRGCLGVGAGLQRFAGGWGKGRRGSEVGRRGGGPGPVWG